MGSLSDHSLWKNVLGREGKIMREERIINTSIQHISEDFVGAKNVSANKWSKILLLEVKYQRASVWGVGQT